MLLTFNVQRCVIAALFEKSTKEDWNVLNVAFAKYSIMLTIIDSSLVLST